MTDFMYIPLYGQRVTSPLTVRVVLEPEGQGWLAYSPELRPYGASTWCTTREAAIRHIRGTRAIRAKTHDFISTKNQELSVLLSPVPQKNQ